MLQNGEWCDAKGRSWVVYHEPRPGTPPGPSAMDCKLGRVREALQIVGSAAEASGKVDGILVQVANIGSLHDNYRMPRADLSSMHKLIPVAVSPTCCIIVKFWHV